MINLLLLFCLNVTITIDDGPTKYTENIVKTLNQSYNGNVIFFITDRGVGQLNKYTNAIKEILYSGYEIGNHTFNHTSLSNYSCIESYKDDLLKVDNYMRQRFNYDIKYFRSPYGRMNNISIMAVEELDYNIVGWTLDISDKMLQDSDLKSIIKNSSRNDGCIILLHDNACTSKYIEKLLNILKTI